MGAEKELLNCVQSWNVQASPELAKKGIEWKFNPPAAPHHGGSWERLVRCSKRVFYAITGSRKLTPEVLETASCLVDQSLNARPLTSVSASPYGFEFLTSYHSLLGRNSTSSSSLLPGALRPSKAIYPSAKLRQRHMQSLASRLCASAD